MPSILQNPPSFATNLTVANTLSILGQLNASTSLQLGTGGYDQAGSIYSNSTLGMCFRGYQASPSLGEFSWRTSNNTELMRFGLLNALLIFSSSSYASKVSLYERTSNGGNRVTVAAPDNITGGADYTLTLPDGLPANNNQVLVSSTAGVLSYKNIPFARCRFNANSGTPTITNSQNVSSVADDAPGDFGINLTSAGSSANNLLAISSVGNDDTNGMPIAFVKVTSASLIDVKTRKWTTGTTEAAADLQYDVHVAIFDL